MTRRTVLPMVVPMRLLLVLLLTGALAACSDDPAPVQDTVTVPDPTAVVLSPGQCRVDATFTGDVEASWSQVAGLLSADGALVYTSERDGISLTVSFGSIEGSTEVESAGITYVSAVGDGVQDHEYDGSSATTDFRLDGSGFQGEATVEASFTCGTVPGSEIALGESVPGDEAAADPGATRAERALAAVRIGLEALIEGDCPLYWATTATRAVNRDAFLAVRDECDKPEGKVTLLGPSGAPYPTFDPDVVLIDDEALRVSYRYRRDGKIGFATADVLEADGRAYVYLAEV